MWTSLVILLSQLLCVSAEIQEKIQARLREYRLLAQGEFTQLSLWLSKCTNMKFTTTNAKISKVILCVLCDTVPLYLVVNAVEALKACHATK